MLILVFCSLIVAASCNPLDYSTTQSPNYEPELQSSTESPKENKYESPFSPPVMIDGIPIFISGPYYKPPNPAQDFERYSEDPREEGMDFVNSNDRKSQDKSKPKNVNDNVVEGTGTRPFPGLYVGRPDGPVDIF